MLKMTLLRRQSLGETTLGGQRRTKSESPVIKENSSRLRPQRMSRRILPNLPSYDATNILTIVNDARFALQKAA
jgi:hypothetical protein